MVTVSQKGKIKAKKTGKAVITVITKRGASASVEIKVQKKKVKTQKLTVTNVRTQKLTLKKGKTVITVKSGTQTVKVKVTVK